MRKKILALTFLNILFLIVACKSSEQEKNKDKESITHLKNSINYDNEATAIMNKYKAFSIIEGEDYAQIIMFRTKALEEASLVDTKLLNSLYPTWGDRFKNEYIEGLKQIIEADKSADAQLSIQGQNKTDKYKNWFSSIRNKITKNK